MMIKIKNNWKISIIFQAWKNHQINAKISTIIKTKNIIKIRYKTINFKIVIVISTIIIVIFKDLIIKGIIIIKKIIKINKEMKMIIHHYQ